MEAKYFKLKRRRAFYSKLITAKPATSNTSQPARQAGKEGGRRGSTTG